MNTIKIFLASSAEMLNDRLAFKSFIGDENKMLQKQNVFLHLEVWEDFIDAMSATRLQDEYNKAIQSSDIFIMLFCTKVGKYTSEEFEKAFQRFKETSKPFIYTYFKNAKEAIGSLKKEDMLSVWAFQEKLKELGHFQTEYENTDRLCLHFSQQLDKLFDEGKLEKGKVENNGDSQIPKCLSAGQPSVTTEFTGRETELADIKSKLEKSRLLLINAEGGMGKTTIAAKYLEDNLDTYKHYAWMFCESGITEQLKTLAPKLNVDLTKYTAEDEQGPLLAIKTAMENLGKDCLLVLDNANEAEHIEAFQKHFGGLHWHVLLTSRCQQVLPGNEYTLNHLKPEQAKALFKTYYTEDTADFESQLDKLLEGIGYNTLMIELFSKNLKELSALGETLAIALNHFKEKGLLLGERSFEIKTGWADNVHSKAATTDQILEVLYDLTKLEENERHILVNLALLPAESHLVTLLIEVLTPDNKIEFAKQLKSLAQKGWLNTDTKSYRISPVVQQLILAKNKSSLEEDAAQLVENLNYKLNHDGASLINLKSYRDAQPYAALAKSAIGFLYEETFKVGLLLLNLSDYYKGVGNFKTVPNLLNRATAIFEKVDRENYGICLSRLGDIYQQQGDFKKAVKFFELYNDLNRELFEVNPQSESLKNGLAISYSKLGDIYQQQGDFKKAVKFFELDNDLNKELFEANPQSESLKNGLAISYEKLGSIYLQQGDFKKALQFFEEDLKLINELLKANPQSESLKNGLAIFYERLGSIYQQQDDIKKALQFFEQYNDLCKELYEANPQSESLKNGLAISYQRLGRINQIQNYLSEAEKYFKKYSDLQYELYKYNPNSEKQKNDLAISYDNLGEIYQQQGDFKKALQFFQQETDLFKELFEANPDSVGLYNGLAVSYFKLGGIYLEIKEKENAKSYFQKTANILLDLTHKVPEAIEYQNNLKEVNEELSKMEK